MKKVKSSNLIFSDGTCVYATFESDLKPISKWMLLLLNVVAYSGLIISFSLMTASDRITFLFPTLIMIGLLLATLTKTTLWNIYGRESIIISTKSVSYYRDYGWFTSQKKTEEFQIKLLLHFKEEGVKDQESMGLLHIVTHDEQDFPITIFESNIKTEKAQFSKLCKLVKQLFTVDENKAIMKFSLN